MTSRDDSKTTLSSDFAEEVPTMRHFIALYAVWSQKPGCKFHGEVFTQQQVSEAA